MAAKTTHRNTVIALTAFLAFGFVVWNSSMNRKFLCSGPDCGWSGDGISLLPHIRNAATVSSALETNHTAYGRVRRENDVAIVFFAVPKTGSRSLSNTFNVLSRQQMNYNYTIVPKPDKETPELLASFLFKFHGPVFFRGHFPIIDLPENYTAISVVRDPLERFISGFNFAKYGDGQIGTANVKMSGTEFELSIDDCVQQGIGYCDPDVISSFTMNFFCGYDPRCTLASEWTFHRATRNVQEKFLLVGVTEDLNSTMLVLERLLPKMAKGLGELYNKRQKEKRKDYITGKKDHPSQVTREKLLRMMSWEFSFYEHVKSKFNRLKEKILLSADHD